MRASVRSATDDETDLHSSQSDSVHESLESPTLESRETESPRLHTLTSTTLGSDNNHAGTGIVRCSWTACESTFKLHDELLPHVCKSHIAGRNKGHVCRWNYCETVYDGSDELTDHLCKVHLGVEKSKHACLWQDCHLRFDTFDELTCHVSEIHVGAGKSRYSCEWEGCGRRGRSFGQRQKVMRHMQTHTGDKPIQCTICKKRFSEANIMTQHMRTHTGEKPYRCDHPGCTKGFSISGALTIHRRVHTGEKPFVCRLESCGKRFAESSNLTKHMRTHTGERPFKCPAFGCDRRFSRPDQVSRHMCCTHPNLVLSGTNNSIPSVDPQEAKQEKTPTVKRHAVLSEEGCPRLIQTTLDRTFKQRKRRLTEYVDRSKKLSKPDPVQNSGLCVSMPATLVADNFSDVIHRSKQAAEVLQAKRDAPLPE